MRTKIASLLLTCVMGAVLVASGADDKVLDLTLGDKSVSTLVGYENVINNSDELRTLTVSPATDETFDGKISGKIKLVKEGKGMLDLTAENTYTGGTVVNQGRLVASSLTAFGDTTKAIEVNCDCQQANMTSNLVTCVGFKVASGTFAYPIVCSSWANPLKGPEGTSACRQYNVALLASGITLTGNITGGNLSVHVGSFNWTAANQDSKGWSTCTLSGEINCSEGTVCISSFAIPVILSGKVTTKGIYQNTSTSWPVVWTLSHADNEIGVIDVGGGPSSSRRAFTVSGEDALGGATVYSSVSSRYSHHLEISKDQTVESLRMGPGQTYTSGADLHGDFHYVTATAAATVTMQGTEDVTSDWLFRDGGATKPLSLIWDPAGAYTYTCVGQANTMNGTIAVLGGTFEVGDNCNFVNVSKVTVANGATFKVGSAGALGVITDVELEEGGSISVPEGVTLTVNSLKVGDKYCAAKTYGPDSKDYITGGGSLKVMMNPSGGEVDAVWTGGAGADETGFSVGSNWEGGEAPDDETSVITAFFAKGGTEATLTKDTMLKGLVFDSDSYDGTVSNFTLAATGDGGIRLGVGGISNAVCSAVCNWTIAAPIEPIIDQVWKTAANAKLTITGPMKKTAAPVTITHLPTADGDAISFVGNNDSDFDGDYIVEQDEVSGRKSGDLFLSGKHPLGVGGKITLVGRESGKSGGHTEPQLVVSNAVVAKAVETKGFYNAYIVAKPDTTNTFEETVTSDSSLPFNLVLYGKSQFVFNKDVTVARKYSSKNLTSQYTIRSQTDDENRRGEVVFNGLVTHASTNYLNARIDVCFNAPSNRVKVIKFEDAAFSTVIRLGASYAFADGYTTLIPHTQVGVGNNHYNTLDLQGFSQHIGTLAGGSPLTTVCSTGGAAELRLNQTEDAEFKGVFADAVTLVKDGPATFALTNACTATGALVVTNGVLELKDGAHWAGTRVEVAAGTLKLDGADTLTDAHVVELGATGAIDIPSDTTVTVRQLFYRDANGDLQPAPRGSYSSGGVPGGLPEGLASRFTGGGTLFVRKNGRPMGFGIVFR